MSERPAEALGAVLRRLRAARGWTQEELAERASAGLSVKTIGNIERGRHRPQRHVIDQIAGALALTAHEHRTVIELWRRTAAGGSGALLPAFLQPPTPLVGREEESAALRQLLQADGPRLVSLIGPAGVGKTRLAQGCALAVAPLFPDGVAFVALDGLDDSRMVLSVIGESLGVCESADQRIDAALRAFLSNRRALLVLDNFEHIVDAAPRIADLVRACPGVRVLVTSRVALHVRGERTVALGPLSLPVQRDVRAIGASAAVCFFIERARDAVPDFALTPDNAPTVAAICARLDGLPLAIELAVPWLKIWSPALLLQRLEHSLQVLVDGARDLPVRQQTLRAALSWSHHLLSAEEQMFFQRIGVCACGWTVAAAAAIAGSLADGETEAWALLARLVGKNMVQLREGIGDEPRFGMLETMREFALERREESGEAADVRRIHARYYLSLAEEGSSLTGLEQPVWSERLDIERDNFHLALAWARGHDHALALQLGAALWRCWLGRGYARQGRVWLAALLERPETQERSILRARALLGLGGLCWALGDAAAAAAACAEAEAVGRGLGVWDVVATALHCRGALARAERRVDDAWILYRESLACARALDARPLVAHVLDSMGVLAGEQGGDTVAAGAYLDESVRLGRALGDGNAIARSLHALAELALRHGSLERARAQSEESLRLRQTAGEPGDIAHSLGQLGAIALAEGDRPAARAHYQESVATRARIGDRRGMARALLGLGTVDLVEGHPAPALEQFRAALAIVEHLGDQQLAVECRTQIARVGGEMRAGGAAPAGAEAPRSDTVRSAAYVQHL